MRLLTERLLPALDRISAALAGVAQVMIVVLIATMIYEVVARRVFNSPTIWSVDIVYMVNGSLFLMGAGYTLMRERHVRIDFLSSRMPARLQHLVNALFYLALFLPLMAMTTDSSIQKAWRAFERGTLENMSTWQPVIWPFLTGIALGIAGLTLQIVIQTMRHLIGVLKPDAVPLPGADPAAGARG
jgi:TRAP-type mannitol/chloroaromatic compound transport system permease small subunit